MKERRAADFFAERVAEYDSLIGRGHPRYREMLDQLTGMLPEVAEDVLELGCGTGSLTMMLASRYPESRLKIVDGAEEMVDLTRVRLKEVHPETASRARFVASTFEDLALGEAAYDLVASNMALHHIVDKQPFYDSIRAALRPGGSFVLGDELVVNDPERQERYWQWWLQFARRDGGLNETEIAEIIEHMEAFDRYETLPRQLEMLSNAGFRDVDCVWRFLNYGVFVGTRPAQDAGKDAYSERRA